MIAAVPLMPDVGVIALVPEKWEAPVRARHQIMPRLARYFNVVWMQPPDGWRECWFGRSNQGPASIPAPAGTSFSIYNPGPLLPLFYKPESLARFTDAQRLGRARRILRQRGATKIVLYLWRPTFDTALDRVEHDLSLYHIVDEYNFSETEQENDNRETRLIKRAGQVIVHSPALMEKKGALNPTTTYLPNGVDFEMFAAPCAEPADLAKIPHPRVGYVGVIKKELDLQQLLDLSLRHTRYSFVFVGPIGFIGDRVTVLDALRARPNVYFLGEKPIAKLPSYNQHIDVALLSYDFTAFNNYIFPLKLHEYMAAGCPVVGTPIKTLRGFKDHVRLATTLDEWSSALEEMLAPAARTPQAVESRRAIARRYDWNRVTDGVAHLIANRLGESYAARMAGVPTVAFAL